MKYQCIFLVDIITIDSYSMNESWTFFDTIQDTWQNHINWIIKRYMLENQIFKLMINNNQKILSIIGDFNIHQSISIGLMNY